MNLVSPGGMRVRPFSGSDTLAAREEVDAVVAARANYLGAIDNVVILPLLRSDPSPEAGTGAWELHRFAPRPQVCVMAPRKRAERIPVQVSAGRRTAMPIGEVLLAAGAAVPPHWRSIYEHQRGARRRRTEVMVPLEVPSAEIVEFCCRAITALDPRRVTGRWLAVSSPRARMPRSLTG
jgi:hypothetical protein